MDVVQHNDTSACGALPINWYHFISFIALDRALAFIRTDSCFHSFAADSDNIVKLHKRSIILGQCVDRIDHAIRNFGGKALDECYGVFGQCRAGRIGLEAHLQYSCVTIPPALMTSFMALSTTDDGVSFGYETMTVFNAAGLAKTIAIRANKRIMIRRMVLTLGGLYVRAQMIRITTEVFWAGFGGNTALMCVW